MQHLVPAPGLEPGTIGLKVEFRDVFGRLQRSAEVHFRFRIGQCFPAYVHRVSQKSTGVAALKATVAFCARSMTFRKSVANCSCRDALTASNRHSGFHADAANTALGAVKRGVE